MSKRDPLRRYMDVIDNMLVQMVFLLFIGSYTLDYVSHLSLKLLIRFSCIQFKEDPSFKPQGGQLGENDMDYDTDEKSMATLRRHLRYAREEYYRCKRYGLLM